jgi:hypothetical protein
MELGFHVGLPSYCRSSIDSFPVEKPGSWLIQSVYFFTMVFVDYVCVGRARKDGLVPVFVVSTETTKTGIVVVATKHPM